jgi:hypothetical protein
VYITHSGASTATATAEARRAPAAASAVDAQDNALRACHLPRAFLVSRVGDHDRRGNVVDHERAARHRAARIDRNIKPPELENAEHRGREP